MSEHERAAWALVSSVTPVVAAVRWAASAWMYLERVPQLFLDSPAVRGALRFERLDAGALFDNWERGRAFDADQELRWELVGGEFHAVYCGVAPPAGLTELPLDVADVREPAYVLWGQQVRPGDRAALGLGRGESAFIDLRIPRVLRYPAPANVRRVRVQVRELLGADGRMCYARWAGVMEEQR